MRSPIIKLILALFVLVAVAALFLQTNGRSSTLPAAIELQPIPTLASTAILEIEKESETTSKLDNEQAAVSQSAAPVAVSTLAPTNTPASQTETAIPPASAEPSPTQEPTIVPTQTEAATETASSGSSENGTLIIDKIDLNGGIVPVPIIDNQWQVEELRQDVGLLAGGGRFPGDEKSMILAGHATTFWPVKGPFAKLPGLVPNDEIVYVYDNQEYTYKISRLVWADPDNAKILNSNNGDQLILVTCGDYDYFVGRYDQRLVVFADLIDVNPLANN